MSDIFENGALVRIVKLHREKKQLGGMWLDEDRWLARKLGSIGVVVGTNPMTNDVYFVGHREQGKRSIAAYGADELELIDQGDGKRSTFLRGL